ncbi:MAG: transporter substrate-binding domain-containing protein [Magnetovibrio sp.]|nr:transporter substrate-binding domain-containing protein [Magnetovibrio sp.]
MKLHVFLFLIVTIYTSAVCAEGPHSQKTMVIGGLSAPPYIFVDDDGHATGILIIKIRQALSQMGIQAKFEISNWPRSFHNAKTGTIDAVIPTLKSPDREVFLHYPEEPIANLTMVMIKNAHSPLSIEKISDLNGKYVGRIRNARVTPEFDEAAQSKAFVLEQRSTFRQLALSVAHNRLDIAIGPELMLLWAAGESGVLNKIKTLDFPLGKAPVYLAISKKSKFTTQISEISKNLRLVRKSPEFENALNPYSAFLHVNLFEKLQGASNTH